MTKLSHKQLHEAVHWLCANVIAAEDIDDPPPKSVYLLFEWLVPGELERVKKEVNGHEAK